MKSSGIFSVLSLFAIVLFVSACGEDDKVTNPDITVPEFGTVSGRVIFDGTWPAVGNVQVSIFSSWPPAGPPYQASPVIAANSATYDFKFEGLAKNTYPAVVIGWRDPANPTRAKVIGIYINDPFKPGITVTGGQPTYATPVPIAISDAKMTWTSVDIRADLSLAQ